MKITRLEWLAPTVHSWILASALSTWNYRPPSSYEIREMTRLLRDFLRDEPGRRSAASGFTSCCAPAASCCPVIACA